MLSEKMADPAAANEVPTSNPLVDVNLITYNHEKFIARAIESVLEQQTTFPYRIIIGDDCSTDNTQSIIRKYADQYPERIQLFQLSEHRGIARRDRVGVEVLKLSTAKYIALLDGDDYWTSPEKLQKQVDFLESHPECSVCFHNARMQFEDNSEPPRNYCPDDQKEIFTLLDIAISCFLLPCTVMFRNKLVGPLPECFFEVANADWMLFVLLAEHGNLGYLNEVMATYRVHRGGIWSKLDSMQGVKEHIKTYEAINAHLNFKYNKVLSKRIADLPKTKNEQHARACLDQYHRFVKKGEIKDGISVLLEAIRSAPSQVFRPRHFAAVLKYGLLGALHKERGQN